MADKVAETVENEVCTKKKEVVDSPVKDKQPAEETPEKENGKKSESENGQTEKTEVDAKDEADLVCPVKRKSGAGGDAPETPADDVTPEKKAKLDESAADADSNGNAEVTNGDEVAA